MPITVDTHVGTVATEYPLATRVFARHGIDFCCGGKVPLAKVCEKHGLDPQVMIAEIEKEIAASPADLTRWDQAPLSDLIDHILAEYHEPLYEELPRIEAMAKKVNQVHGESLPAVLPVLLETFLGLKAELEDHFAKEEQILFPMIRAGRGSMAAGPVSVMEHEHDMAGAALAKLRAVTTNYELPEYACNTWRALWFALAALEQSLHEHIHLENNILFPRALAG